MREHGSPDIGEHTLADLVHQRCAKIASGGQHHGDQCCADHRPIKECRVLAAKSLVDKIGQPAPHCQQRARHHKQRHGSPDDAPAMRAKIGPEDTQQGHT